MPENIRIAMFSGPRNISTTLMRSFENRPDTDVIDEPFYACYLKASGARHPMREAILASQLTTWESVSSELKTNTRKSAPLVFEKHIAFHFINDAPLDWVENTRPFFLIRDPRAMIASYKKKYDDIAPVTDSFQIQRQVYEACRSRGAPCPVIDAADILNAPEKMLRRLCAMLDIEFRDEMLSWPLGPRETDGVWAPHWYDAVWDSTGFKPYVEKPVELPPDLAEMAAACMPDYDYFWRKRVTP